MKANFIVRLPFTELDFPLLQVFVKEWCFEGNLDDIRQSNDIHNLTVFFTTIR